MEQVVTRSGSVISIEGDLWRVGVKSVVDWSGLRSVVCQKRGSLSDMTIIPAMDYIVYLIENRSSGTVSYRFTILCAALKASMSLDQAIPDGIEILYKLKSLLALLGHSDDFIRRCLQVFRAWYIWSAERTYKGFSSERASEMASVRIKSGQSGVAVMRMDPELGPLTEVEAQLVERALENMNANNFDDLQVEVACKICFALGLNSESLRQLEETDLLVKKGELEEYILNVPLIKKRGMPVSRMLFQALPLHQDLARFIQQLISANERLCPKKKVDCEEFGRPLFRRREAAAHLLNTPFESEAYRVPVNFFTNALRRLCIDYSIRRADGTARTITPQILRRTFATRQASRGAEAAHLMMALGHSDTRTVLTYVGQTPDLARSVDSSMGDLLAPLPDLFFGRMTAQMFSTTRLGKMLHRDRVPETAPSACRNCTLFQPFKKLITGDCGQAGDQRMPSGNSPMASQEKE